MAKNDGLVDPRLGARIIAEAKLTRAEARVERAIKRALMVHKSEAFSALSSQHLTAAVPPDAFNITKWDTTVDNEVAPDIEAVLEGLANGVFDFLKLPPATRAEILGQLDLSSRTAGFTSQVKTIGPDVAARLLDELQIGIGQGESIPKLSSRIDATFDIGMNIAARIARTETHGVAEATTHDSAGAIAAAGFKITKSWLATHDRRVRDTHIAAEADNQNIPHDEAFVVGGSEMMYPGDPYGDPAETINCRCSVTYDMPDGSPAAYDESDEFEG